MGVVCSFVCITLVSGCGWHIQGQMKLPETAAVTYIEANDRYTEFNRALRSTLGASGARLTEAASEARAVVRVRRDVSGQRILSVSARNKPEEYEVYYLIEYSVEADGKEVIEPQVLELTRDYSYDEAALLAKQREERSIRAALARDLAGLVTRRLASL